jgi:hypothetical protein
VARRRIAWGLLALLGLGAAQALAQGTALTPPALPLKAVGVFAVLGENLEVSNTLDPEASRIDRTERKTIAVRGIGFDRIAADVIRQHFTSTRPTVHLRLTGSAASLATSEQMRLAESARRGALPGWIIDSIQQNQLSHVLLVTRTRGPVFATMAEPTRLGRGDIEGIGFHIDMLQRVRSADAATSTQGLLVPHVLARLTLFEVENARVLRETTIDEQWGVGPRPGQTAVQPWDLLSQEEKIKVLHDAVRNGVRKALPELLGGL